MNGFLTGEEINCLFRFARRAIREKAKDIIYKNEFIILSDILKEKRGCFVTLTINKVLRGCVGYIDPVVPLYKAVAENAYNAAYDDARFQPLSDDEYNKIKIEISALSVPEKLHYKNTNELLGKLSDKKHGVIVRKGSKSATFLPQVWNQIIDEKEFLSQLCLKAGLSSDAWVDGFLDVELYEVVVYYE